MKTYEISQYQRKPLNESMRHMKNTAASSNYSYDTYFNMNLQKSVSFDNFELEDTLKELEKEAKQLRIENAKRIDQINTLQKQLKKLNDNQSSSHNNLCLLRKENDGLKRAFEAQEKQLDQCEHKRDELISENNALKKDIFSLRNQLEKSAQEREATIQVKKNSQRDLSPIQPSMSNEQQRQYENELNQLRNQIELLNSVNKQLNGDNKKLQEYAYDNQQLLEENAVLKNENRQINNNNQSLLEELKSRISKLNSHIKVLEQEKKNTAKAQISNKSINEEMIKELKDRNAQLEKDKGDLNRRLFDMKKNTQAVTREKESLIERMNQLEDEIKSTQPKNQIKSKAKSDNEMLIECLKRENVDLKSQHQRMRKLNDLLIAFVNNIAALFGYEELSPPHAKDNSEETKEFLANLQQEIERLKENKSKEADSKWQRVEEKLLYKPNEVESMKSSIHEEGEEYKLGKCTACDLGCNATLKGCSPLFARKNNNPTNLPKPKKGIPNQ